MKNPKISSEPGIYSVGRNNITRLKNVPKTGQNFAPEAHNWTLSKKVSMFRGKIED